MIVGVKDSATDIWFFGIWSVPSVEITVPNFRLFLFIETDLKAF